MKRVALWIPLGTSLVWLSAALADKASMAKLLPSDAEVKPWQAQSKKVVYTGVPADFTLIYDGGDGEYTDAGAVEGLQQLYRNGDVMELVVHRMGSAVKAKGLWSSQVKDYSTYDAKPVSKSIAGKAKVLGQGSDYRGMLAVGKYYVTATIHSAKKDAAKTVDAFLVKCATRIQKYGK